MNFRLGIFSTGINFRGEGNFCGEGTFRWVNFTKVILHLGNFPEFLYKILLISATFSLPAQF